MSNQTNEEIPETTESECSIEFLEGHCTLCESPLISEYCQMELNKEIEESTYCEKCGIRVRQKLHTLH